MSVLKFGDRVREVTDTEGSVDYHLNGTTDPLERTFVEGIGSGERCYYCCESLDDWEIGYGLITVDPGGQGYDTLTREVILSSSNNDLAVPWSAGNKTIFNTATAASLDHIAGFQINESKISFNRKRFLASSGQTDFEFSYLVGSLEVRKNGLVLTESEVTAQDGENFTISACVDTDIIEAVSVGQYSTTHNEAATPVPTGQIFKSGMFFNDVLRNDSGSLDGIATSCIRATSKESVSGDAVALNGTSSHIDLLDLGFVHSAASSVAFWLTTATTLADATVFSNQSVDNADGYLHIRTTAAGNLEVAVLDGSSVEQTITFAISVSTEYHVVVIYDGTDLNLWVDGVKGTPLTTTVKTTTPTNDACFGCQLLPTPSSFFEGKIVGINIYDFALSDAEVALVYSEPDEPDVTTLEAVVVPGGSVATNEDIIAMVIALG